MDLRCDAFTKEVKKMLPGNFLNPRQNLGGGGEEAKHIPRIRLRRRFFIKGGRGGGVGGGGVVSREGPQLMTEGLLI